MRKVAPLFLWGLIIGGCHNSNSSPVQLVTVVPPAITRTAIIVKGVRVIPPDWFPLADHQYLAILTDQHIREVEQRLNWVIPSQARTRFPLQLLFHDILNNNQYNPQTRTAWLEWPKKNGKPSRDKVLSLFGYVAIYDRRQDLGLSMTTPFSTLENSVINYILNWVTRMDTFYPEIYD